MADDFYLDENGVLGVADGMRRTGDALSSSFNSVNDALNKDVGCWGNDEIGKSFEQNYWANATKMLDSYRPAGQDLIDGANNMARTARDLASVDLENAKWLDSQKPDQ